MKKILQHLMFLAVLLSAACSGAGLGGAYDDATSTPTPTASPTVTPVAPEKIIETVVVTVIITSTPEPTKQATEKPADPTAIPTDAATTEPTAIAPTAPVTSTITNTGFNRVAYWNISGQPSVVDPKVVLQANGAEFKNSIGLGSQMMLAEPGTLLVGPDFDPQKVKDSGGRIEWISPITQQMLGTETFSANTAEGAFLWATGSSMTVKVREFTITVNSREKGCGNNWFVIIRGLFADGKQDSDRNSTTQFSNYIPGHTQAMWYPGGAFISEENFLQVSQLSHTDGRNCGAEGTSGLSVFMLDLNTGAFAVLYQANLNQPWQFIASNWFMP